MEDLHGTGESAGVGFPYLVGRAFQVRQEVPVLLPISPRLPGPRRHDCLVPGPGHLVLLRIYAIVAAGVARIDIDEEPHACEALLHATPARQLGAVARVFSVRTV